MKITLYNTQTLKSITLTDRNKIKFFVSIGYKVMTYTKIKGAK
jgi:hypothetical protein